ncbi:electron transport complex subunit RsxC [Candidatus Poribacteria bacterium]|nr:MAG: electron transport complex subunit RsxC [Candidatus Poribacteria bacterium]
MKPLFKFRRGVHPPYRKLTASSPIQRAKTPEVAVIPLKQHAGAPAQPVVSPKESVSVGQLIGKSSAFISANVHSSVTGVVKEISPMPTPSGEKVLSVVIETTEDETPEPKPIRNPDELSGEEIVNIIAESGIVGMGGAGFPTHVKLKPPKPIDTLIINGCECEPYLTGDHRLMLEKPDEIIQGIELLMKALNVRECYIGIEDNKPDAIKLFEEKLRGRPIKVVEVKTKYPQGAEKVLIKSITGREVPVGGLPLDVGVVVQNVGTAHAVYEAVILGKPLYERVVTVTGEVNEPKNLLVRIGTPISQLIEECGGYKEGAARLIMGGPMMGIALFSDEVPVIKTTTGLIALPGLPEVRRYPCINCGTCIDVCPMGLIPKMFPILYEKGRFQEAAEEFDVMNCMECGCCEYECPSRVPIVQSIRAIKSRLRREGKR